jgi:exodeoxyribonuclease V beta subunit
MSVTPSLPDTMARFEVDGPLPFASLALEASAGTGKTWTLTALAVRYLAEHDIQLPELLLVTFTRAATAELRDRVRVRIAETLQQVEDALADPGGWVPADDVLRRIVGDALARHDGGAELELRRDRLQTAAEQLDEATISTIHGFCQRMLQHAALEAGIDLDAVLLEDDVDLLAEIVDDFLARELRPADPDWVRYLQRSGKVKGDQLAKLARAVSGLPALQIRPALTDDGGSYSRSWDDAVAHFTQVWQHGGRERAIAIVADLKDAGAFAGRQATFNLNAAEKKADRVDAWLAEPPRVPPPRNDRAKGVHNLREYPMGYFTAAALETKLTDGWPPPVDEVLVASARVLAAALEPATLFLHRAATYIWRELDRRKRQRTVLTFDDLLRRLADALGEETTRDAVRQAIRQRYRVALIDEFQDTDPIQWRIFSALFAVDEPFVLIGDPKQAIYGFRGADIHTYVTARDGRPDRRTLQRNHRSDESYVEACNQLFGQLGAFATDDIPYHRIAAEHPDRLVDPRGGSALQIRFVSREAGELDLSPNGAGLLKKGWANRALPDDVAAVAVELLDGGLSLQGGSGEADRLLAPRDLAVLVRTNRRANAVQRALHAAGVPAVIQRGGSVFATDEAEAIQRLLTAMLRPNSERAAIAAAASILFGRDAATLVTQLDALEREVGGTGQAWDAWIDALTRWGERWQRRGVLPALQLAFAEDGVPERLLSTSEGERRLTNVRHLGELLHTAETTAGLTPNALIDWLQTHRADAADGDLPTVETELRLEEDAEAVRVVTVHGSKGLQYPVVLCPDLWDGAIQVDQQLTRFHDPEVADPSEAIILDLDADLQSAGKQRSIALATREARAEQLRLAYVALTRAQHRCIVWWGAFRDAPTSPLASLLHGEPSTGLEGDLDGGDRLTRGEARLASEDQVLLADLTAFAKATGAAAEVRVVSELERDASWDVPSVEGTDLRARPFTRGDIDRTWRRTSFTALVRGADPHGPARPSADDPADGRDVDADADADLGPSEGSGSPTALDADPSDRAGRLDTADEPDVPLADLPRGAGPGTFLHDVLERVDLRALDDDQLLDELLAAMERRHGIDPRFRPTVVAGLRAAAATPLGSVAGDVRLADLAMRDRLNELRFELPLAGGDTADGDAVTLHRVADLLEDAGDPLLLRYASRLREPALRAPVRGFLNGSIDLLARLPDGRFLVADYKSNWLGDRVTGRSVASDYGPLALADAMLDSHYVLQALLYLVATHRYLRWRVPHYDYDTHVAGGAYLFLRGMIGPGTPVHDGMPNGVVAVRPDGTLVRALSRLLDGGPA